jgi:hypothetical protein
VVALEGPVQFLHHLGMEVRHEVGSVLEGNGLLHPNCQLLQAELLLFFSGLDLVDVVVGQFDQIGGGFEVNRQKFVVVVAHMSEEVCFFVGGHQLPQNRLSLHQKVLHQQSLSFLNIESADAFDQETQVFGSDEGKYLQSVCTVVDERVLEFQVFEVSLLARPQAVEVSPENELQLLFLETFSLNGDRLAKQSPEASAVFDLGALPGCHHDWLANLLIELASGGGVWAVSSLDESS